MNAYWLGVLAEAVNFAMWNSTALAWRSCGQQTTSWLAAMKSGLSRSHARDVERNCMALYVNPICSGFEYI